MTIMIDDDLIKKIRKEQAKLLQKSIASVSFFEVLAHYVKQGIKNGKK